MASLYILDPKTNDIKDPMSDSSNGTYKLSVPRGIATYPF